MKAQGLPINFIVLAAVAILILILAAGFIIGGGTSVAATMTPTAAKNACDNQCKNIAQYASTITQSSVGSAPAGYCTLKINLGAGTGNVNCTAPAIGSTCSVTFADGSFCQIGCNWTTPPTITCK